MILKHNQDKKHHQDQDQEKDEDQEKDQDHDQEQDQDHDQEQDQDQDHLSESPRWRICSLCAMVSDLMWIFSAMNLNAALLT